MPPLAAGTAGEPEPSSEGSDAPSEPPRSGVSDPAAAGDDLDALARGMALTDQASLRLPSTPPADEPTPRAPESISPLAAAAAAVRLNVLEIRGPEHPSDNTNHAPHAPSERTPNTGVRVVPWQEDSGTERESEPPITPPPEGRTAEEEPPLAVLLPRVSGPAFDEPVGVRDSVPLGEGGRPSLSSVLGARFSIQPSPPPPPDRISLGWWILILFMSGIIVAAGVVMYREAAARHSTAQPTPSVSTPPSRPEVLQPTTTPLPTTAPIENAGEGGAALDPAAPTTESAAPTAPARTAPIPSAPATRPAAPPPRARPIKPLPRLPAAPAPTPSSVVPELPRNPYEPR